MYDKMQRAKVLPGKRDWKKRRQSIKILEKSQIVNNTEHKIYFEFKQNMFKKLKNMKKNNNDTTPGYLGRSGFQMKFNDKQKSIFEEFKGDLLRKMPVKRKSGTTDQKNAYQVEQSAS